MTIINIIEGRYAVRNITDPGERKASYRLRYEVFARELKWVPENPAGLEMDEYDRHAVPFGVFSPSGVLIAYIRLVPGGKPFMMDKEFRQLVCGLKIRREKDSAELSRLCVAQEARNLQVQGRDLWMLLLKGVYKWCRKSGIRLAYGVVEEKKYKEYLLKGLPLDLIGMCMGSGGEKNVAVTLDWDKFNRVNLVERPQLYSWFNSIPD